MKMTQKSGTIPCFQISEIGRTGFLFAGNHATADLSSNDFPKVVKVPLLPANKSNHLATDPSKYHLLPPQKYLNESIGVFFQEGQLYIPFNGTLVPMNTKNVYVSGREIYGNIQIVANEYIMPSDLGTMTNLFVSKGFDVLYTQYEGNNILHIFWRFKI